MANKAYQFRIYPTEEQKFLFAKTFGCVRLVYNYYLEQKIKLYQKEKKNFSYTKCSNDMTALKKTEDYLFLSDVDSIALQQSLRHLEDAFQNFFSRPASGFPKFKSRRKSRKCYTTVSVNGNISLENGYLKLPKAGLVKVRQHRQIPDNWKLKSVTISQSASGKYDASILFEYENQVQEQELHTFLGLDFSMHELYKDSNGNEPAYPRYYRQAEKKLQKEQRKLSLMTNGSANYEKQRVRVAILHEKVANQRKDFLHKLSRKLANAWDCICIENLNMQAMAQALHFGKSVCDNGWGMFTRFLQYKLEEIGKILVKVDRFFASSQTCSCCGYKNPETKDLSVRAWDCPKCGTHHDRDVNAAINIRNKGMRLVSA